MVAMGEYVEDGVASAMKARDFKDATDLVAHALRGEGFDASEDGTGRGTPIVPVAPTLRAGGHSDSHANAGVPPAIAFQPRIGRNGRGYSEEVAGALNGADAGATSDMRPCVALGWRVRRLTPVECERLQGFPDGWTALQNWNGYRAVGEDEDLDELREAGFTLRQGKNGWRVNDPDGPRYKALGNSMAVNVMTWIGERLDAVVKAGADA